MKHFFLTALLVLGIFSAFTQVNIPPVDKSPMDASYCPGNYPVLKTQEKATDPLLARVIYGRPSKSGRTIFGDLIEYGKVWRIGANEATEIEFFQNVKFGNARIKKGRYTLYAIPEETKWTLIINKETDTWGSFGYNMQKDIARIEVPVQKLEDTVDLFSIVFEKREKIYELQCYWENTKISVPLSL